MKKKHHYHGFLKKYQNVYLYIAILVGCGLCMGIILSNYIDVNDIQNLSAYLTTIDSNVNKYDYFISQFFLGILFILFVFLLGTSIAGILLTLLPQVVFDLLATFLISASAIQLSMYIVYSCTNRERLGFRKLFNTVLNDIFICFLIMLVGAYLKSTIVIEFIKLFNLM